MQRPELFDYEDLKTIPGIFFCVHDLMVCGILAVVCLIIEAENPFLWDQKLQ